MHGCGSLDLVDTLGTQVCIRVDRARDSGFALRTDTLTNRRVAHSGVAGHLAGHIDTEGTTSGVGCISVAALADSGLRITSDDVAVDGGVASRIAGLNEGEDQSVAEEKIASLGVHPDTNGRALVEIGIDDGDSHLGVTRNRNGVSSGESGSHQSLHIPSLLATAESTSNDDNTDGGRGGDCVERSERGKGGLNARAHTKNLGWNNNVDVGIAEESSVVGQVHHVQPGSDGGGQKTVERIGTDIKLGQTSIGSGSDSIQIRRKRSNKEVVAEIEEEQIRMSGRRSHIGNDTNHPVVLPVEGHQTAHVLHGCLRQITCDEIVVEAKRSQSSTRSNICRKVGECVVEDVQLTKRRHSQERGGNRSHKSIKLQIDVLKRRQRCWKHVRDGSNKIVVREKDVLNGSSQRTEGGEIASQTHVSEIECGDHIVCAAHTIPSKDDRRLTRTRAC